MGYVMKVYWILHCQHLFNLLEGWSLSVHDWEGAILCYGMIKNHAFFDRNKRIGIYAMLVFLELNGMEIECSEEELIALGLGIASGEIEEKDIAIWIVKHNREE